MRWRTTVAAMLCAASAATILAADDHMPLPTFDVLTATGVSVSSAHLSAESRWLVVYVVPECGSCDRLLMALVDWQRTLPPNRIVVIVGAALAEAATYAADHRIGDAAGIAWYADPSLAGRRALGLQRSPALIAVEEGRRAWIISGVLNDPQTIEPAVRGWTLR